MTLGVVDNQLVRVSPLLEVTDLQLGVTDNQMQLYAGHEPIVTGVGYFVMKEDPGLDVIMNRATGAFTTTGYGQATLRAVALGRHMDITLVVPMQVLKADPTDPEDFDVSVEGQEQAQAERNARRDPDDVA